MEIKIGTQMEGFRVLRSNYIKEQEGTLYEMVHEKTGAELCFLDASIDNKTFYAAFKTLPYDNTGVFHILEHSVLCGSDKYPVREPFVELLKSSMQTFLNALTFPDKTVYPVASRNEEDFLNLMEVYLDAAFAPRCTHFENIFLQEGWRIENENGKDCIKGVVFNEMKGAMADPDTISEKAMMEILCPGNCYHFVSGGNPSDIPDLSYEAFCNAYRRFYHPTNCRLYLDGSVPLVKSLRLIDGYLSRFDKIDSLPEIPLQGPHAGRKTVYYEIGAEENEKGMSLFSVAKLFSGWDETIRTAAMVLLLDAMTSTNSAPLKKGFFEKELCLDLSAGVMTGMAQNILYFTVRNTDPEKEDALISEWTNNVQNLIDNGIDKKDIEAKICEWEYRLRDAQEPRGIDRGLNILESWLYGGDPSINLRYEDMFRSLREMLEGDGFEKLLPELIPSETDSCFVWTIPSKTIGNEKRNRENKRIESFLKKETETERISRYKKIDALKAWQSTSDTAEQLSTLPTLNIEDIDKTLQIIPTNLMLEDGVLSFTRNTKTYGLIHAALYFAMPEIEIDDLPRVKLLSALLGEIGTKKYPDVNLLQREISLSTAGLSFSVDVFEGNSERNACKPYLSVSFSTVPAKTKQAGELVHEILLNTAFAENKEDILDIVMQEKDSERSDLISRGHSAGMKECSAPFSAVKAAGNAISGLNYIQFLQEYADYPEEALRKISDLAEKLRKDVFCKKRLTVSVTSDSGFDMEDFTGLYPDGKETKQKTEYRCPTVSDTGIMLPVPVGFAAAAWRADTISPFQRGVFCVAAKILSLNTLWNKIRVRGGAYGAGISVLKDNLVRCYSFRDPSPQESLRIFKSLGEELQKWCDSGESPDKYIIACVSEMNPLISSSTLALIEDARMLDSYSLEERQEVLRGILGSTVEELRKIAELLYEFGAGCATCLVGPEHLIAGDCRTISNLGEK